MHLLYKRGSVKPNTAACTKPSELKSGSFRGVTGTAIFKRNISPKVGKKLLMKGLPADNGLPAFASSQLVRS